MPAKRAPAKKAPTDKPTGVHKAPAKKPLAKKAQLMQDDEAGQGDDKKEEGKESSLRPLKRSRCHEMASSFCS